MCIVEMGFSLFVKRQQFWQDIKIESLINWASDSLKSLLISFVTNQTKRKIGQPLCNHPISPNVILVAIFLQTAIYYPQKITVSPLKASRGVNGSHPHNKDAASGANLWGLSLCRRTHQHGEDQKVDHWTLNHCSYQFNHLMDTAFSSVGKWLMENNQALLGKEATEYIDIVQPAVCFIPRPKYLFWVTFL